MGSAVDAFFLRGPDEQERPEEACIAKRTKEEKLQQKAEKRRRSKELKTETVRNAKFTETVNRWRKRSG